MAILQWQANEPVQVQLKFQSGKHVAGRFGEQVMFSLMDGNIMYVPLIVEKHIQALQIRRGQPVEICKHQEDGKTEWKVRRIEAKPAPSEPNPAQPKPAVRAETNGKPQAAAELLEQTDSLDSAVESYAERNLEQALRISLMAAKKAEEYGASIGKPVQFDTADIRLMANTMLINGRGRAA